MEFAVAVYVEWGVKALLVFQEVAFADEAGFAGVEEPEEVVFVSDFHVFVFGFDEVFGDADGAGEADGVGVAGSVPEEDAGVAVGDHHFQTVQKFGFDLVEAGTGIKVVDHVIDHQKGIFFHGFSPFLEMRIFGVKLCSKCELRVSS